MQTGALLSSSALCHSESSTMCREPQCNLHNASWLMASKDPGVCPGMQGPLTAAVTGTAGPRAGLERLTYHN